MPSLACVFVRLATVLLMLGRFHIAARSSSLPGSLSRVGTWHHHTRVGFGFARPLTCDLINPRVTCEHT